MSRKIIGIVVALALAAIGTLSLVAYVSNAEERAQAGETLVEVYVVDSPIAAGTPVAELEGQLRVEWVPDKVRAENAVGSLNDLDGLVTGVDLVSGEQLVTSRFVQRSDATNRAVGIVVPDGMVEVTIELDAQRAVGGFIKPGETVAVIASFDPFDLKPTVVEVDGEEVALPETIAVEVEGATPNSTHMLLRKVLITARQRADLQNFDGEDDEGSELSTSPNGSILVTLAVPPGDAERLVFTAEFGSIWLAAERTETPEGSTQIQTRGSIYDDADRSSGLAASR